MPTNVVPIDRDSMDFYRKILDLVRANKTVTEIAALLGVTDNAIRCRMVNLKAWGITWRHRTVKQRDKDLLVQYAKSKGFEVNANEQP